MWTIARDAETSFEDAVGICPAQGWSAQIEGEYKPLLFWVVLRNGQLFGVIGEGGLQPPRVADSVMNFTGYFPTP